MNRFLRALRSLVVPTLALIATSGAVAQAPQPPEIAARNYLLMDFTSGQILAAKDIDAPVEQASLTKLMAAYVVFDALRAKKVTLEQKLPVSERAWKMPGSRMFIDPKMQVSVDDLLSGMIIQSGNDATMALAEGVGGTAEQFVKMMNDQAAAMGLKGSAYKNPEGLTEPGHYTSARDVATVAARIITEHPAHYAMYREREYTYNRIRQDNRNLLLARDPSVDGMKTGYTEAAGYCLVASATRDTPAGKRRLLSVVLGTASMQARAAESQKLLNWGWLAWDAVRLFEAGQAIATVPVWKGTKAEARLGAPGALFVTVPKGEGDKLKTTLQRIDPLVAPLTAGQGVGTVQISTAAGTPVATVPLVVIDAVPLAGLFGRAWDAIRLWIK